MPAVKITQKPIGIPGDDTHFIVTQPELPEGYTPTGQETEEELAELKVESVREIEMNDMVELIQDKLDMDVTPTTGSSKPVTSGGIKAALDLMDDDISSLNEDISNLENEITPKIVYKYRKADLRTGSLQPNSNTDNSTSSFAIKAKMPLEEGASVVISPAIHDDMPKWGCRVVAYTNEEMTTAISGTIKVNNFNITDDHITYTQSSGFLYILIGLYYYNADGSYSNVSDQFNDDDVILVVDTGERKEIAYKDDINLLNDNINSISSDLTSLYDIAHVYSPIEFTAEPGWMGGQVYSLGSHYHVTLNVAPGEKYHVKTVTNDATTISAVLVAKQAGGTNQTLVTGTASGYIDEYIEIPDGFDIMYVNCAHLYSVTIEKYMSIIESKQDIYPSYFQAELDNTIEKTRGFCSEKALVFAVVTDSHLNSVYGTHEWDDTAKNIVEFDNRYKLDEVIHLGDMINGTDTKEVSTESLDRIRCTLQSIKSSSFLMGNHDTNTFYGDNMDDPITEADMYADMFRQNALEIIRPDGKLYGYKDYDNYGIRVVYLCSSAGDGTHGGRADNCKYPDDELTWVQNTALNTNYQVLFFSHMPFTEGTISTLSTLPTNGNALKTIISNFVDNGGVVIGLIHGHTHYDNEFDNGKFKEISVGCEAYTYSASDSAPSSAYAPTTAIIPARLRYTATQDLWDVVIVRPVSRTVKLVRFGAGADRSFSY